MDCRTVFKFSAAATVGFAVTSITAYYTFCEALPFAQRVIQRTGAQSETMMLANNFFEDYRVTCATHFGTSGAALAITFVACVAALERAGWAFFNR